CDDHALQAGSFGPLQTCACSTAFAIRSLAWLVIGTRRARGRGMQKRLLFSILITGCATSSDDLSTSRSELGFSKSETKDGHTFTLTCESAEGLALPGNANVLLMCYGSGQYRTTDKPTYITNVPKFKAALNAAAPVLNQALKTAAAAAQVPNAP